MLFEIIRMRVPSNIVEINWNSNLKVVSPIWKVIKLIDEGQNY